MVTVKFENARSTLIESVYGLYMIQPVNQLIKFSMSQLSAYDLIKQISRPFYRFYTEFQM